MSVIQSAPVGALTPSSYAQNDVTFYRNTPDSCSTLSSINTGTGSISQDESKNAEIVLRYLTTQMGMTLVQATGFTGNMHAESGINPKIIQGGSIAPDTYTPVNGIGFGLVQWTYTSRQQPMADLAKSSGRNITDINLQLDFINKELTTSYKSTLQALASTPDLTPEKAVIIVHGRTKSVMGDPRFDIAPILGYEASADTADGIIKNRATKAREFYNAFNGKISDGKGISVGSTNLEASTSSSCSESNAVASNTCDTTKPYYGEGGNSQQLHQAELEKLYGKGGDSVKPNLVTVDFLGKSVQVHKNVAGCLNAVVNELKVNQVNYTIKQIGGWRSGMGGGGLSNAADGYHYYGVAIDINPDTNPCYFVSPFSWCYKSTDGTTNYDIPRAMIDAFHHHGWSWGGGWHSMKDLMHFEYNGKKVE